MITSGYMTTRTTLHRPAEFFLPLRLNDVLPEVMPEAVRHQILEDLVHVDGERCRPSAAGLRPGAKYLG